MPKLMHYFKVFSIAFAVVVVGLELLKIPIVYVVDSTATKAMSEGLSHACVSNVLDTQSMVHYTFSNENVLLMGMIAAFIATCIIPECFPEKKGVEK